MLAKSSDNVTDELRVLKATASGSKVCWSRRALMLGLNFIPLLHAASTALLLLVPYASLSVRTLAAVGFLYLAPPLVARMILFLIKIPEGQIVLGTKPFFAWWGLFQLQIVFCRFTMLEETLRLVPGLYSQWLRLWGARIGRFTYWSPGTLLTDRSYLQIGDDVVFGAGVRLNSHVLSKDMDGGLELVLATVKVGDRTMVGGYSLLTAGTEISSDQVTRAFLLSPPFSVWKNGKRLRPQHSPEVE